MASEMKPNEWTDIAGQMRQEVRSDGEVNGSRVFPGGQVPGSVAMKKQEFLDYVRPRLVEPQFRTMLVERYGDLAALQIANEARGYPPNAGLEEILRAEKKGDLP